MFNEDEDVWESTLALRRAKEMLYGPAKKKVHRRSEQKRDGPTNFSTVIFSTEEEIAEEEAQNSPKQRMPGSTRTVVEAPHTRVTVESPQPAIKTQETETIDQTLDKANIPAGLKRALERECNAKTRPIAVADYAQKEPEKVDTYEAIKNKVESEECKTPAGKASKAPSLDSILELVKTKGLEALPENLRIALSALGITGAKTAETPAENPGLVAIAEEEVIEADNAETEIENETNGCDTYDPAMEVIEPEYQKTIIPEKKGPKKFERLPADKLIIPNLYHVVNFFRMPMYEKGVKKRIVGGENVSIMQYLCFLQEICFGIEAKSGHSKSMRMNKLRELIESGIIYSLDQASDKALYNKKDEINRHKWLYVRELQKAKNLVEVLKSLSEGAPATYDVTVSRGKSIRIVLDPKPVCFTIAYENRWDLDAELRRRFLIMDSTSSKEEIKDIHKAVYEDRCKLQTENEHDDILVASLQKHMYDLSNKNDVNYLDPFANGLEHVIPSSEKSQAYMFHYINLLNACAKFHYNDRVKFKHGNKEYILLNLEDHFNVHRMYHADFINVLSVWDQSATEFAGKEIDWQDYLKRGIERMKDSPDTKLMRKNKIFDKWYEKQVQDGAVMTVDYETGEMTKITDAPVIEI